MSVARQAVTRLTLDMSLDAVQKSVAISKGDTNRRMEITLTDAGRPFALPSAWTATLSGGQVEDGCVVERGRILYDLSSGVLTEETGIFELAFRIFDEEGDEVATPMITCNVYDVERNTAAVASTDEFSVLQEFVKNINEVDTRLDNIDTRLRLSRLTIPVTEWTDGMPYQATAWLPDMEFGQSEYTKAYTALLIPLNKETRLEAQKTELRVNETIAFTSGRIEIILLREDHVPSVPLDFAVATLMLDNPDTTVFKASASFVGVTELPDELMEREVMRVVEPHFDEMQEDLEEITESVTQLGKRTIISMVTINPSHWSDSDPYAAFKSVFVGLDNPYSSGTILLIPLDPQTRAEARKMELSVDYAYPSSVLLSFWMTRTEYAPTVPLNFAALTVLSDTSPGDTGFSIAASFVGVTELPDELMDKEVLRVLKANKYANEERVTELINESLGVIENGSY